MITIGKVVERFEVFSFYDEEVWTDLFSKVPQGFSWREEAFLAGEDHFEEGKEFLRSN